jgi:integrase
MSRALQKLSARRAATLQTPGRHSDGGGLYLVVDKAGARRWVFMFRWKSHSGPGAGRIREMGLGSARALSLAQAREDAAKARALVARRIDPIAARQKAGPAPSFADLADALVELRTQEKVSDTSLARLKRSLEVYAQSLRPKPIDEIDTEDVLAVLQPIWREKPATAEKVQSHICAVLDAAKARGHRGGDNPARWKGHLDQLLPRRNSQERRHHEALPYADLPEFFAKLSAKGGTAARALQFTILTAARSSETFDAAWREFNPNRTVWTVPAARMKEKREHRVPLTPDAKAVLDKAVGASDALVFANTYGERLSSMAMTKVLRDLGYPTLTVHGFRSTFRDWVGDATEFPGEIAEAALSHAVGDQTERAYRRGDALERRRTLMQAWADYCLGRAAGSRTNAVKTASDIITEP